MNQDAPVTAYDNSGPGRSSYRTTTASTAPYAEPRAAVRIAGSDGSIDRESTFEQGVQSQVLKGSNVPTGCWCPATGVTRGVPLRSSTSRALAAWDPMGDGKTSVGLAPESSTAASPGTSGTRPRLSAVCRAAAVQQHSVADQSVWFAAGRRLPFPCSTTPPIVCSSFFRRRFMVWRQTSGRTPTSSISRFSGKSRKTSP